MNNKENLINFESSTSPSIVKKQSGSQLSSILHNSQSYDSNDTHIYILDLSTISYNPNQPRFHFDDSDIISLADSIRRHGLIHPLTVRKNGFDEYGEEKFELIAGERRLRALRMLGKSEAPCLVLEKNDLESAQMSIIENMMRKDLNMFEYAYAIESLINNYQITQEELAQKMSSSQSNIANKLRLLRYADDERRIIIENSLSERHARTILRIKDKEARLEILNKVSSENLNVKETESLVDRVLSPKNPEDISTSSLKYFEKVKSDISSLSACSEGASAAKFETPDEIRIVIVIPK